ncbi:MAG: hypothetical protein NT031_06065 [Planctomycetota bacterium]|nr:hypothetical protein [Planctomycetota bacterium]
MIAALATTLLAIWAAFAAASLLAMTAVLLWAVRTRQFANQQHLAALPLTCESSAEPEAAHDRPAD